MSTTATPIAEIEVPAGIMRVATIATPMSTRRASVAKPEPGPGEVRIRLQGSGVCASSLPVWEGRQWFQYPFAAGAPGHEGWGIVDAVAPDVTSVRTGDRVAALSYHAFAEYDIAKADAVVPLPSSLDDVDFPGEPLGCAMNIFERSDIRAGQTVAIVGVGFLGLLLTQLAVDAGARVIAVSRRQFALDLARQYGADALVPMDDHQRVIDRVKAATAGEGCDRVIEAVGQQWPLDLAGELTRERGRLIIAGYHQDGPRQVNVQLWNWRGLDVINAHERDPKIYVEGMEAAIAAIVKEELDPSPLYTHFFKLDQISSAFNSMRERPDKFLKALVTL